MGNAYAAAQGKAMRANTLLGSGIASVPILLAVLFLRWLLPPEPSPYANIGLPKRSSCTVASSPTPAAPPPGERAQKHPRLSL